MIWRFLITLIATVNILTPPLATRPDCERSWFSRVSQRIRGVFRLIFKVSLPILSVAAIIIAVSDLSQQIIPDFYPVSRSTGHINRQGSSWDLFPLQIEIGVRNKSGLARFHSVHASCLVHYWSIRGTGFSTSSAPPPSSDLPQKTFPAYGAAVIGRGSSSIFDCDYWKNIMNYYQARDDEQIDKTVVQLKVEYVVDFGIPFISLHRAVTSQKFTLAPSDPNHAWSEGAE